MNQRHEDATDEQYVDRFSRMLSTRIGKETFDRKYAPAKEVLKLVGAGAFLAASMAVPNLPRALKPFLRNNHTHEAWKRFNIPYLKQTLDRLQKQKLIEYYREKSTDAVRLTDRGRKKIQLLALESFAPQKPSRWNGFFTLFSFDLPEDLAGIRKHLVSYLHAWNFYPLQKSVYLHAYPCRQELDTLCSELNVGQYVCILTVTDIDHKDTFREFFDLS